MANFNTTQWRDSDIQRELNNAIDAGDNNRVIVALNSGANLNQPDRSGWLPLMTATSSASLSGDMSIIELMCQRGADPEIRFRDRLGRPEEGLPITHFAQHRPHYDRVMETIARCKSYGIRGGGRRKYKMKRSHKTSKKFKRRTRKSRR